MTTSMIDISNIINITATPAAAGLAPYSINNLVCFTKTAPSITGPSGPCANGFAVYQSYSDVATDFGSGSDVATAAANVFGQSPNILSGNGLFIVVPMLTNEVLEQAIVRAQSYVYFGGLGVTYTLGVTGPTGYTGATGTNLEALRAAAVAKTANKLMFLGTSNETDLTAGLGTSVKNSTLYNARVLFHTSGAQVQPFQWSYASRGMSTNFNAVNSAISMELKTLSVVTVDSISTTQRTEAKAAGVDIYPNIAGQPSVESFGANSFYDDIYNLYWLIGALQVAGFNYLKLTNTKIPQTESGMEGLKGSYRTACIQAVKNGYLAPGTWTGSDTFGIPEDFVRNISDFGFYVYSSPISQQSAADRAARNAPVIQIALKTAGAIHSSSVIVNINA